MAPSKATKTAKADFTADYPGSDNDSLVTLRLAHPISEERDLRFLGLPLDSQPKVNDTIAVSKNAAKSLITAGLVQVDPENRKQVRAALAGEDPDAVADLATEPGQDQAERAATPAK